jgi:serine/threonine-protein kinase
MALATIRSLPLPPRDTVPSDPPAASEPPAIDSRYEYEARIGEGGMGTVGLYRDLRIGRRVAVKVIRPERAAEASWRERFVREARVQAQLEHPAVVPVYDVGVDSGGRPCFTMRHVRGISLFDILEGLRSRGPGFAARYTRRRLLTAFASICLAVDYAHEKGVVHRDLKPENFMLGDFGECYVLDWGLAKIEGRDERIPATATLPGMVLGTPGFMSPEQVRGEPVGPASDVYALGAILFEILTLEPLHPDGNAASVLASTLRGADARPSARAPGREVPPELEAICVKATARSPQDRYASARDLCAAVERTLDGERDVALRQALAGEHARSAAEAVDRAEKSRVGLDARRVAMREAGRALALDPSNEQAMEAMMRLFAQPPKALPPEIASRIDDGLAVQTRRTGRLGAIAFASLFLYLPLLAWIGVRDWAAVGAFYLLATISGVVSFWTATRPKPGNAHIALTMLLSQATFSATSIFFGPLLVMPLAVALSTVLFAIHSSRFMRWIAVGSGALAATIPIALERVGWIAPSFVFKKGLLLLRPGALAFSDARVIVALLLIGVGALVTSAILVSRLRDALGETEREVHLRAWHLAGLVPDRRD